MTKQRMKTGASVVLATAAMAALLWRPQAVTGGVSRGLAICGEVLIPSLFPFLVLSGFLIRSGAAAAVGRRAGGVTRRLFGLPGCTAAGILIGLIGGYPSGATAVGELVRSGQISREEAKRMLRFCVNGGPGFVIGAIGIGLTGSVAFGTVLYGCHVVAALLLGVVGVPRGERQKRDGGRRDGPSCTMAEAFVESVTGACASLVAICSFVLLFSAVLAWVDASGIVGAVCDTPQAAKRLTAWIACLLEVSCGCTAASSLGPLAGMLTGFAVGFGGLSVHCQVAATLRGTGVMDTSFFLSRFAQGVLTAALTVIALRFVPVSLPVGQLLQRPVPRLTAGSVAVSAALLVLCGVWMLTVGRLDKPRRNPYN
jgi:sporulation integral membrane protein YlbJ